MISHTECDHQFEIQKRNGMRSIRRCRICTLVQDSKTHKNLYVEAKVIAQAQQQALNQLTFILLPNQPTFFQRFWLWVWRRMNGIKGQPYGFAYAVPDAFLSRLYLRAWIIRRVDMIITKEPHSSFALINFRG